jgi:hypothetical protein
MPHTPYLILIGALLATPWLLLGVSILGSLIRRLRRPKS